MADFLKAYKKTNKNEGGYIDDLTDAGGETYAGISRNYNKSWEGWKIIDYYKNTSFFENCKNNNNFTEFNKLLKKDQHLQELKHDFYKEKYWDIFLGDDIPSQMIADELFDTGVNMGTRRAVKFLQTCLNILNRNERLYKNMFEDGIFGPTTFKNLQLFLKNDEPDILFKMMNVLQGMHYINYMSQDEEQEKYCRGWFKRVQMSKI